MEDILKTAKAYLFENDCSCVVMDEKGSLIASSNERGVKTLLQLLSQKKEALLGAIVADKIIGKAAACLLVYGGIKKCYGHVMSEEAIHFLQNNSIQFEYGSKVAYIENRDKTDMCPMEKSVLDCQSADEGYNLILAFIERMMKKAHSN